MISGVIIEKRVLSTSARTLALLGDFMYCCSSETVSPSRERFWVVTYTGILRVEDALSILSVVVTLLLFVVFVSQ